MEKEVEALKNNEPLQPSNEDGTKENPYEAYRGMTYFKDKYYYDAETEKLYICTRDNDNNDDKGITLNYLPHELVGHYFQEVV